MHAPHLTQLPAWKALEANRDQIARTTLRELFAADPTRGERMAVEGAGLYLDYSKNRANNETLSLLVQLAQQSGVEAHRDAMFAGQKINVTEDRAVLHVALRAPEGSIILLDGVDVVPAVHKVLKSMGVTLKDARVEVEKIINNVIARTWRGCSAVVCSDEFVPFIVL